MQALIDLKSEVNVMHLSFAKQLGFPIRPTNVGAQKIDGTMLDTHRMVVAAFWVVNKANQVRFFEKIFLVANVSLEEVFGMSFLTLRDADVDFLLRDLRWRIYTSKEALATTTRVELVDKKEFAAATLDPEHETYVVHVASLSSAPLIASQDVHSFRRPQISGLIAKKALTVVF